jgi:PhzF family phenazine biosynthesis protein
MTLAIYQIDAFAEKQFEGNPAAVVPLEKWLSDSIMQAIAEENNRLSHSLVYA